MSVQRVVPHDSGNDQIDVHQFTGSLFVTSSLTIDTLGSVSGSGCSTGSFGSLKLTNLPNKINSPYC